MDPLLKKVLLRTFVFLLCILFSAWLIFIVENSEKDSVEKKYQLLLSLYELMASNFIMTNEEFYNFSSLAFQAFTEWTQTTEWTSVAAQQLILSFKPSLQLVSLTTHKWSSSVTCNSSCHHNVAAVIVLVLEAIVSVVFSIVFSRGNTPCVWDLVRIVIRPRLSVCPV